MKFEDGHHEFIIDDQWKRQPFDGIDFTIWVANESLTYGLARCEVRALRDHLNMLLESYSA
jgi:hypothetical protein